MERVSFTCPGTEAALEQPTVTNEPDDLLAANIELFCHTSAIPFQIRSRYLVGDNNSDYGWVPLDEVATKIGSDDFELHDIVNDLRAPNELRSFDKDDVEHVAPALAIVVSEEYQWRQKYADAKDEVTPPQIAKMFDMPLDHIENLMQKICVAPSGHTVGAPGVPRRYPKELLYRVRAEIMAFPTVHEGRKTQAQIVGEFACSGEWVHGRSSDDDADPDLMRDESSVRVSVYYAKPFVDRLRAERAAYSGVEDDDANKWTRNDIGIALGRRMGWVDRELRVHISKKVTRYNQNGRPYDYYDDSVFQDLQKLSEKLRQTPVIREDELPLTKLVRPLGMTEITAEPILKSLGIVPVERRALKSERILNVYSVGIQEALVNRLRDIRQSGYNILAKTVEVLESGRAVEYEGKVINLKVAKWKLGLAKKKLDLAIENQQRFSEKKAA